MIIQINGRKFHHGLLIIQISPLPHISSWTACGWSKSCFWGSIILFLSAFIPLPQLPFLDTFEVGDTELAFATWLSMAIFNVYINFICQQLLRNQLFASKPLPRVRQHASIPIPLLSGLKDYVLLKITHLGHVCGLRLSLLSSWEGWNPMLGVCKGSLLYMKESLTNILTRISFAYRREGLQAVLWLSAAACVCRGNIVLDNLEEKCLRKTTILYYELVFCLAAFCSFLGVAEKCVIFWSAGGEKSGMINHGRFFFPRDLTLEFQSFSSLALFPPERTHGELSGSWTHKSHESKTCASWARHDFN